LLAGVFSDEPWAKPIVYWVNTEGVPMARKEFNEQEPKKRDEEENVEDIKSVEEPNEPSGASGWLISAGTHGLFLLIFSYAVWTTIEEEISHPPIQVAAMTPPPNVDDPKSNTKFEDKTELKITKEADTSSPISQLDIPPEENTTIEDDVEAEVPRGDEDAVSDIQTGSTGAFMAIGAGSNSAGMIGKRTGGGKKRALADGGGTRESEDAVGGALRWFKRHQSPNGMWDSVKYRDNCQENPKCEPGQSHHASDANIAMTGYAILCFLGAGYDHQVPGSFKNTVEKGLNYLVSVQTAEGNLGPRNYEHAIATMALAEAYAMTSDVNLREPAQKALDVLVARQIKDGKGDSGYNGLGWDYVTSDKRNDSSVTGWCVMALKSGLAGGLNIGNSMEGAKQWLQRSWEASNPDWQKLSDPYADTSTFAYTWNHNNNAVEVGKPGSNQHDMAPVGALCAVFLNHTTGDMMLESLCNHIMKYQFPTQYPCNTYYMYYNTLAMFQASEERFKKWNNTVRDMLVNAQRKDDGCFNGSWDNGSKFHGSEIGRVLHTAYCCLSLEVYYRYERVRDKNVW
jgi:hypothetical protein